MQKKGSQSEISAKNLKFMCCDSTHSFYLIIKNVREIKKDSIFPSSSQSQIRFTMIFFTSGNDVIGVKILSFAFDVEPFLHQCLGPWKLNIKKIEKKIRNVETTVNAVMVCSSNLAFLGVFISHFSTDSYMIEHFLHSRNQRV